MWFCIQMLCQTPLGHGKKPTYLYTYVHVHVILQE